MSWIHGNFESGPLLGGVSPVIPERGLKVYKELMVNHFKFLLKANILEVILHGFHIKDNKNYKTFHSY